MVRELFFLAAQGTLRRKRVRVITFLVLLSFSCAILSLSLTESISGTNEAYRFNTFGSVDKTCFELSNARMQEGRLPRRTTSACCRKAISPFHRLRRGGALQAVEHELWKPGGTPRAARAPSRRAGFCAPGRYAHQAMFSATSAALKKSMNNPPTIGMTKYASGEGP